MQRAYEINPNISFEVFIHKVGSRVTLLRMALRLRPAVPRRAPPCTPFPFLMQRSRLPQVDGLSDDAKIDTTRDIHERVNEELEHGGFENVHLR